MNIINELWQALPANAYIAGGAVRDYIYGVEASDIDILCLAGLEPSEVMDRLDSVGCVRWKKLESNVLEYIGEDNRQGLIDVVKYEVLYKGELFKIDLLELDRDSILEALNDFDLSCNCVAFSNGEFIYGLKYVDPRTYGIRMLHGCASMDRAYRIALKLRASTIHIYLGDIND